MNLLIGLLLTAATTAAAPVDKARPTVALERIPVFLQTDAPDPIGAAYVAKFREALERSSAYRPVANPADARFLVGIVTMDPSEAKLVPEAGRSTVAAVTLQHGNSSGLNQFVYSWVLIAKSNKVDSIVTELVTAIDKEIREIEGLLAEPSSKARSPLDP